MEMPKRCIFTITSFFALAGCVTTDDKARAGMWVGFDAEEAVRFAVEDVCLPAASLNQTVSERFEEGASSSGFLQKRPDRQQRNRGIVMTWKVLAGNTTIYDGPDRSCSVISQPSNPLVIRSQMMEVIESADLAFESLYSGKNAPGNFQWDVYCADAESDSSITVLMTVQQRGLFQLTTMRDKRSCSDVKSNSKIAIPS